MIIIYIIIYNHYYDYNNDYYYYCLFLYRFGTVMETVREWTGQSVTTKNCARNGPRVRSRSERVRERRRWMNSPRRSEIAQGKRVQRENGNKKTRNFLCHDRCFVVCSCVT